MHSLLWIWSLLLPCWYSEYRQTCTSCCRSFRPSFRRFCTWQDHSAGQSIWWRAFPSWLRWIPLWCCFLSWDGLWNYQRLNWYPTEYGNSFQYAVQCSSSGKTDCGRFSTEITSESCCALLTLLLRYPVRKAARNGVRLCLMMIITSWYKYSIHSSCRKNDRFFYGFTGNCLETLLLMS